MDVVSNLLSRLRQVAKLPEAVIRLALLLTCLDFRLKEHRETLCNVLGVAERTLWKHYQRLKKFKASHISDKRVIGLVHVLAVVDNIEKIRHDSRVLGYKVMRVVEPGGRKNYIMMLTTPKLADEVAGEYQGIVCNPVPAYTCPWVLPSHSLDHEEFFEKQLKASPTSRVDSSLWEAIRYLDARPYAHFSEIQSHVEKNIPFFNANRFKNVYESMSREFKLGRVLPRWFGWFADYTPIFVRSHNPLSLHMLISKHLTSTGILVCENGEAYSTLLAAHSIIKEKAWSDIVSAYILEDSKVRILPEWRRAGRIVRLGGRLVRRTLV